MKYALTLSLWIIGVHLLIGQEVDITLNKQLFEGALGSVIMVSSDDGSVVHEFFFRKNDVKSNVNFQVNRSHETQKLHLTICNEYFSPHSSTTYLRHVTRHDIEDNFYWESDELLKAPKHFTSAPPEPKDVKIYITSVDETNKFATQLQNDNYRIKRKKREMVITGTHFPGTDLFILLKCNNEEQYRYIYLSDSEVKSYLYFDYNDLSKQLVTQTLDLKFPHDSRLSIRAECMDSGNRLLIPFFVDSQNSKMHIYAPEGLTLSDFNIGIRPPQPNNTYSLHLDNWEDFADIWDMVSTNLKATWDSSEKELSFSEEVLFDTDEFILSFYVFEQLKVRQTDYGSANIKAGGRFVKGVPQSTIKAVIPEIPGFYYNDLFNSVYYKLADYAPTVILYAYSPEGLIKYYVPLNRI